MNLVFETNKIRLLVNKKAGRRRPQKVIPCLYCPSIHECECKKVKVKGIGWKQWVPARQYCLASKCGKRAVNFRSSLAKKLLNKEDQTAFLTAQYCLWKMMGRTPIKYLSPVLSGNFIHAVPQYPCRFNLQLNSKRLEKLVESTKMLNAIRTRPTKRA